MCGGGGVADELESQLCLVLTAQRVAPSSLLARCLCPVAFSDALRLTMGLAAAVGLPELVARLSEGSAYIVEADVNFLCISVTKPR